ncbi:MAG: TraR/DksA family transcriptional regulator [Acidobacteria bacterium]|nr:TraR/DksA family transcriptional regulator [Acidobacteriota bacterium]
MRTPVQGEANRMQKTFRKALMEKKAEILVALGINFRELADPEHRLAAEDNVAHEEFVRLRVNRVLQGQLRQIEDSLERLKMGEYGICESCGAAIPSKRLLAIPWARFCVDCQEQTFSFSVAEAARMEKEY